MSEGWAKYMSGKVLGAMLTVAGVIIVIWYYRLAPADRAAMWDTTRNTLVWIGFVAILPWALFFVPPRVLRTESNAASALMLAGYVLIDALFAVYLIGGVPPASWHRAAVLLGLLCAAAYNYVVCEFIAQKAEDTA